MNMTLKAKIAGFGMVAAFAMVQPSTVDARDRQHEQNAARRAMLDGHVMPFSMIKRRVDAQMGGATYVGSEFDPSSNRYRLKYVRDGKVVWVDADGRTGDIIGWAR